MEKATALEKAAGNKRKSEALNKKLKQNDSDATMDTQGFPRMFGENPAKTAPDRNEPPAATSSVSRRRNGNKAAPLEKGELHKALGFGAKKRPASAMKKTTKKLASLLRKRQRLNVPRGQLAPGKTKELLWKRKGENLG